MNTPAPRSSTGAHPEGPSGTDSKMSGLQTGLVFLLALSALINYVDRQATGVIGPYLRDEFHFTKEQLGWTNSAFALTYICTSALGGIWIDRVGIRKGLTLSTVAWSLAAAGHALVTGFSSLCFWRAMLAVGEGPGGAALLKGVRRVLPHRFQDGGVGIVGAGTILGALLAPLLINPLAAHYNWRVAFLVTASLGTLWLPFWIALAHRPQGNLGPKAANEAAAEPRPQRLDLKSYGVWATAAAVFFTIPPTVFTLAFFPLYLNETFALPVEKSTMFQWQPYLAMDLGQLTGGAVLLYLMRRGWEPLHARRLVMSAGFTGAAVMLLMVFAPSLTWAMAWLNLSRFLFQFAYVALLAYGISVVRESQAGTMNGFMNATFGACTFVFNPLIGKLADVFGSFRPALVMVSLSPLVGLTGWLLLSHVHDRDRSRAVGIE